MKKLKIGVIGCGNMGEAVLKGLLAAKGSSCSVLASDPDASRRNSISRRYGIKVSDGNLRVSENSEVIVLAVKPRDIDGVLRDISKAALSSKLVISIAAGISVLRLEKGLGKNVPVVRAMPNMPALVGCGVTAICSGIHAKKRHVKLAKDILSSIGDVIEIDEARMDAVTAISGSGPAYFFYLVECMIEAARELGLGEEDASNLVVKTAIGAARVLEERIESPQILRAKVASKGGTTEAAFRVFESKGFKEILKEAIRAGHARSKELGAGG